MGFVLNISYCKRVRNMITTNQCKQYAEHGYKSFVLHLLLNFNL